MIYLFLSGLLSSLAFAPLFFLPTLFLFSYLIYKLSLSKNYLETMKISFLFGFGHFITSLYWISFALFVYIDEFWWLIPFSLFGLPLFFSSFFVGASLISHNFRKYHFYPIIFSLSFLFMEWVRSFLFTGFPWNVLSYSIAFSNILAQFFSIVGIYGMSFAILYISTSGFYIYKKQYREFFINFIISISLIVSMSFYGYFRLKNNSTEFMNIKVRLVQPSIKQSDKWDEKEFWNNLESHIQLSQHKADKLDIIIWSESAMIAPFEIKLVQDRITNLLKETSSILITGGISYSDFLKDNSEIYVSLYGIDIEKSETKKIFEYYKSHLVPFGEYIPFKNILNMKKITKGMVDYTSGKRKILYLNKYNLKINPLICYESIFPDLVRDNMQDADIIINVTNDSWYGNSSGPYQHFYMNKIRAIENGIGMLRSSNNGISAIIDPVGRVINSLSINEISFIDNYIPKKLNNRTIYSQYGDIVALIFIILILLIHYFLLKLIKNNNVFLLKKFNVRLR
jgi:apolipoprotein N-acyltransferase